MPMPLWLFPRSRSFFYGFTLPWTALKLVVSRPILITWSLIPIALTLLLYYFLISWLEELSRGTLNQLFLLLHWNPDGWAAITIIFFTKIMMLLVAAFTFSISASILASPFNDWLAECAEPYATPPLDPPKNVPWRVKLHLIRVDILKTLAALVGGILAILMAWIPFVNLVAMFAAFMLVTFQYTSYPQTRRGEGLKEGFAFLWRYAFACAGLGASLSFLFAVPFLSSFCLPLAVVAGTLLYARANAPLTEASPRLR